MPGQSTRSHRSGRTLPYRAVQFSSLSKLRFLIRFWPALMAVLIMPGLSAEIRADGPPPGAPPPLVKVAPVVEQDVNPPVRYVGHVEALQTVDLRARVEGFLEQVNFREGSDVRSGQLLYAIEQTSYQAKVESDRAVVAQYEALLTKARQFLQRAQAVRSGAVSATDLENAQAEERRALAQLSAAKANLKLSELNLAYTEIKAPISGRIGRTAFTQGNLVNAASGALARIVQIDPIRVIYSISENDLAKVRDALSDAKQGKQLPILSPRLELPGGRVLKGAGRIDFVDNAVDPTTGTIAVRALFDNRDEALLPGQYVTVLVARSAPQPMPVVPQAAVLEDQQGSYVLVVDDQSRVQIRRIQTGQAVGPDWAVREGVSAGERVVIEGIQKARPGQVVKTVTE
jgi:RND family efflux transporter MFP subunit